MMNKSIFWIGILLVLTAVAVYAALPSISLDSPVSFPIDI